MIKQRTQLDCGVCALAMFTGKTYEEIEAVIAFNLPKRTFPVNGMNNEEIAIVLDYLDYRPIQVNTVLENAPAICTVPSLGSKKAFHFIYWDGKEMHDPANFEIYTTEDFKFSFPLSNAVMCLKDLKTDIPSHYINHFDFKYINKVYR